MNTTPTVLDGRIPGSEHFRTIGIDKHGMFGDPADAGPDRSGRAGSCETNGASQFRCNDVYMRADASGHDELRFLGDKSEIEIVRFECRNGQRGLPDHAQPSGMRRDQHGRE